MVQNFGASGLAPGEYTVVESFENEAVQGRWESHDVIGGVIVSTAADAGNTSYTSTLRAGLLMGMNTSTEFLAQFDPTATNGTEEIFGIMTKSQNMNVNGVAANRFVGGIVQGGYVDPNFICLASSSSKGIVGNAYEWHIRKLLRAQGFKLTDAIWEVPYGVVRKTVAKTADYTITTADRNCRFTNAGAAGAVIFTLPATARLGLEYWFNVVADQTLTITAGTADTMIAFNDIAADSVSFAQASEKVGGSAYVYGDGSKWVVEVKLGFESQTITVAT